MHSTTLFLEMPPPQSGRGRNKKPPEPGVVIKLRGQVGRVNYFFDGVGTGTAGVPTTIQPACPDQTTCQSTSFGLSSIGGITIGGVGKPSLAPPQMPGGCCGGNTIGCSGFTSIGGSGMTMGWAGCPGLGHITTGGLPPGGWGMITIGGVGNGSFPPPQMPGGI
jgi:hypothetical protein